MKKKGRVLKKRKFVAKTGQSKHDKNSCFVAGVKILNNYLTQIEKVFFASMSEKKHWSSIQLKIINLIKSMTMTIVIEKFMYCPAAFDIQALNLTFKLLWLKN